ncbi:MAG: UDP-N-acetylglucosamine 2-epimerase (non-hydrolyzing) [Ignavibacteria bacterium]
MVKKKKIISVVGARPNFMKLAPLERELRKYKKYFEHTIVHTGQHYDYTLSKIFFKDLDLPEPDIFLGAGSASHAEQTSRIMQEFEKVVIKLKPDLVIVYGDVNSTLACSLVCAKIHYAHHENLPVAHVESGLRSFDRKMPEEINRIVTDTISKYLFVTEKAGVVNLVNEGIDKKRIFLVGDVMIDSLIANRKKIQSPGIMKKLNLKKKGFILVTIHRPSNADSRNNLAGIVSLLESISGLAETRDKAEKIIFPIHPRTKKMAERFGLASKLRKIKNLVILEPAGYTDFINMLMNSKLVITDSGGIQEEATFLRIPCLTLRDSFERPETITIGTNTLCGLNNELVLSKVREVFEGKYKKSSVPKLMDGKAARRIVKILKEKM